ncbi:MAG: hypothetical protein KDA24_03370 [Deltaproteobacteria bacterium]|nr:hypothetical protein [Deltaproteobacteria bacterium]
MSVLLGGCFPPLPTVPLIERVDAFCDTDGNWNLFAEVTHEDGPEAVEAVFVEVGLAFRDDNDQPYSEGQIGPAVDLIRLDGTEDEWGAQVGSNAAFLDCEAEFEYFFVFIAEDDEGDQAGRNFVN